MFACTGRRHRASARSFKDYPRSPTAGRRTKRGPGTHGSSGSSVVTTYHIECHKPIGDVQAQTFDAAEIDKELGWAEDLGMNTMRVFLHDLGLAEDPSKFKQRIEQFLKMSSAHHIKPLFRAV